ncbi:hypothetical protein C5167_028011 [Papaver somniferum]|uniref:metalloendoproteinase 3-MMP-like n=1 Tax=Papaver somniferum TaxID=3469 RepID=UPI000E6FA55D|nr:metalloendoproteinase 3-MMP-like [Papaver somniferum]RZC92122.1 hypothetical protein C5167_028011 [Papaver somniferum]
MRTCILLFVLLLSLSANPSTGFKFQDHVLNHLPNFTSSSSSSSPWDYFKNFTGCQIGEERNGLAKLKQYFHHFGYIQDIPISNFTDNFDYSFEKALKTYQKNFNLNQTGILDNQTLQQIQRPRCGVADIINGASSMNSGKTTSDSHVHGDGSTKFHSVAHYTFFPGQPRWRPRNRRLTYAFAPGKNLPDNVKLTFANAFKRWAEVTPLSFVETESYSTANIRIAFANGDHGDGEPFDGTLGTLAHAFSPPNGRFHLDSAEDWIVDGDASTSNIRSAVDLESVAVHEIGHLLGLGHSSVEESIMYPTIASRKKKVVLRDDDIEGIQVLYGGNPNYNGTSTIPSSSHQEREESSNGGAQDLNVRTYWWAYSVFVVLVTIFY